MPWYTLLKISVKRLSGFCKVLDNVPWTDTPYASWLYCPTHMSQFCYRGTSRATQSPCHCSPCSSHFNSCPLGTGPFKLTSHVSLSSHQNQHEHELDLNPHVCWQMASLACIGCTGSKLTWGLALFTRGTQSQTTYFFSQAWLFLGFLPEDCSAHMLVSLQRVTVTSLFPSQHWGTLVGWCGGSLNYFSLLLWIKSRLQSPAGTFYEH